MQHSTWVLEINLQIFSETWARSKFLYNQFVVAQLKVFRIVGFPTVLAFSFFSALRGRVYLPQDELAQFGLCDEDIFSRKVTDGWREFMKQQITRARFYFNQAEKGASQLDKASRWPVYFWPVYFCVVWHF